MNQTSTDSNNPYFHNPMSAHPIQIATNGVASYTQLCQQPTAPRQSAYVGQQFFMDNSMSGLSYTSQAGTKNYKKSII